MKRHLIKTIAAGMLIASASSVAWAGDVTKYVNPLFGSCLSQSSDVGCLQKDMDVD